MAGSDARQREALLALVTPRLGSEERVVAMLPFANTPRRPKGPTGKVRDGVWQAARRYRPIVLTDRRLFVLDAVDADLAAGAIVLMLAVVGASLLGYGIGLAVALEAFVLLIYLFAAPKDSFAIHEVDDVVALVAFVAVSVIVGAVVARLNDLRERAALAAR